MFVLPRIRLLSIIVVLMFCALSFGWTFAQAADRYWTTTLEEGDWSTPEYWGGTEPTSTDRAHIENGGTALITEYDEVCGDLYLGHPTPGKSGSVQLTAGDLNAARIYVYNGIFDQVGGINQATSVDVPKSTGEYHLSGTGVLTASNITVGVFQDEEAVFMQSGESNTVADTLNVGFPSNSKGSYEMHGGLLSARDARIGYYGTGTFTQTAGINTVSNRLVFGYNTDSSGFYNLSGSGQLNANYEHLNIGSFNQSGGVNRAASLLIGLRDGWNEFPGNPGNSLYSLTGPGQLQVGGEAIGMGKFVQTDGAHTVREGFDLGTTGTYELSGTGQFTTTGSERIAGAFKHSSGVHIAGSISLSASSDHHTANYELSGTGILRSTTTQVGLSGIFTQSGGFHGTDSLQLGSITQAPAIYHLTGGILEVKLISVGYNTAIFNFGGGTIRPPIANPPTGLNLQMPSITLTGIGGDAKIDMPYAFTTLSGSMSGEGGFRKLGAGTLKLSGTNTYAGSTTIEAGTLHVKKAASLANCGTEGKVVVEGGATLALKAGGTGEWTADEIRTATANAVFLDGSIFGIDTDYATGDNFTYGNELAGNFHFTKLGSDTLTLTGLIDYPGTTTISGGTLCIATPTSVQSNVVLHEIIGTGNLIVGDGVNPTHLTATSIQVNSLTIRGTIGAAQTVPEPGTIALLLSAFAAGMFSLRQFRKIWLVLLAAAMLLVNSSFLRAASRYWAATLDECDWSVPEYWGGNEPTSSDDAYITNGGTAYLSENGECCYSLSVGNPGSESTSTLRMTGGDLYAPTTRVGYSGTGIFDQSGGIVFSSSLYVGYSHTKISQNGTYNLSGKAQLSAISETIGGTYPGLQAYPGTGVFTQSGGINSIAETLAIGTTSGSSGTYRLIGDGQLSAKNLYLYGKGNTSFIHSAGLNTISEMLSFGSGTGTYATYSLSGTGQLAAYIEEIQFGAFDHSAGINTAASLYLGSMPGSNYAANASYNLSESGQLTVSGYEVIGGLGTGIFTQTGGIHTVAGTLDISTVPPSGTASYSLSGTGVLSAQTESIALSGKGSFSQTGGTHTVTGTLALGSYSGSVGTYELSGNGQLLTGNVTIGSNSATGTFTQSGGTNRILGTLTLSSPSATYNLTGGRLIVKTLPNSSFGKFNFGGGTFMPTSSFATSQPMTFTGIGGDAKIDTRLYQLILTGSLTGEGGLKKLGENSLGLGGTNSYSGSTTVEEGTLSVPRVVSLPGYDTAGKVVVKPNGTLTVIVGASFGWTATEVYSLATNATFEDGATFGIEATSTADGGFVYDNPLAGNFSLIKLGTGSLTLTGAIDYLGTTTIASGTLCIATPASVQSNVVLHDIVGAGNLIVGDGVNPTTLTATSIHVNSLTIGSISGAATVPEPSSLALSLTFLAAAFYFFRRK